MENINLANCYRTRIDTDYFVKINIDDHSIQRLIKGTLKRYGFDQVKSVNPNEKLRFKNGKEAVYLNLGDNTNSGIRESYSLSYFLRNTEQVKEIETDLTDSGLVKLLD